MAKNTDIRLRSDVIYSVYVRNHTEEGSFRALIDDLDRIKALGTDIVWLMPIHPIGVKGKKGSLGCPYANRDYRSTNPEYGSMEDFRALVDEIHKRGMKCIIDVVYNHTSPDSVLTEEHPEFFYKKPDGSRGNRVGDWSDVVDLDYGCRALWDYQRESLVMWAGIVDGFRCDVASFVPVEFWEEARAAVEKVRPGAIWLAETVYGDFGQLARKCGIYSARDYEMFRAFDMEYDYDVWHLFRRWLEGSCPLSAYIEAMNMQEITYPENHIKMRYLENHDQRRICATVKDDRSLENLTAFLYFLKGCTLIYGGQEYKCETTPSLFEKDVFARDESRNFSRYIRAMSDLKKTLLSPEDHFMGQADDENHIAVLIRDNNESLKLGVFSLKGKCADVKVKLPDGVYENHIDGGSVTVKDGVLRCEGRPIVLVSDRVLKFE